MAPMLAHAPPSVSTLETTVVLQTHGRYQKQELLALAVEWFDGYMHRKVPADAR
jgi:hypothetical protein